MERMQNPHDLTIIYNVIRGYLSSVFHDDIPR